MGLEGEGVETEEEIKRNQSEERGRGEDRTMKHPSVACLLTPRNCLQPCQPRQFPTSVFLFSFLPPLSLPPTGSDA
ncbi:hypothetical protein EYF80_007601 [Liparis tanakae]|uniref:Uncharacterized protein n=1 Tax=Liparis tanakae TaxID=230148 RepID=A0A4Z2IYB1_9TELE|nr:hypothetical protein EYF80_007601 [Liparis tanakae]